MKAGNVLSITFFLATIFLASNASLAEARGPCARLHGFEVTFRTGSEDLRTSSKVVVSLTTASSRFELQHVLGGFGNNSSVSRYLTFRDPDVVVNSCDVTGVKVQLISQSLGNDGPDIWSMDAFTMHGYADTGSYAYYLSASGHPLKRFTGRSNSWEMRD